jgi:membrane protein
MATTRALPWAYGHAGCLARRHRRRANEFKLITDLDDHRRKDAGVSASDKTASRQPASGPGQPPGTRPAAMTAAGWPGVRRAIRAAPWGKKKYAGSLAEDVWRRLDTMDFLNRGMVFAATLLLCLFPFLIVVSALADRPAAQSLVRYTGLNGQAAGDIGHLFASSAATTSAVVGTASMVFFVFSGIFAAAALQEIYEQAFDLPHRRIKDLPHRLAWLAVLVGASLLSGRAGPGLRHVGGPALLAVVGLVWAIGFWWLTMRILLAGRISWRALFPAACATSVLYVAMQVVFSLVFSAMVISNEHTYGPIGTIFALLSYLIAIGVVVILGAVAGRAWHERSPGASEAGQLPPAVLMRANTVNGTCTLGRRGASVNARWRGVLGPARHATVGDPLLLSRGVSEGGPDGARHLLAPVAVGPRMPETAAST